MVGVSICKHSSGAGFYHQIRGSEYWYLRREARLASLYFRVEYNSLYCHHAVLHFVNLIMIKKKKGRWFQADFAARVKGKKRFPGCRCKQNNCLENKERLSVTSWSVKQRLYLETIQSLQISGSLGKHMTGGKNLGRN